ncbi:MAG: BatA domain-containing protein [Akkermansia sp.]
MSFTMPWLLAYLGVAFIPILIHLINQWRHRSMPWAAMTFILRANKELKGRKKLIKYAILALRTLAVLCLIIAFAGPMMGGFLGWRGAGDKEIVLILDRSASMGAKSDHLHSMRDQALPMISRALSNTNNARISLLDSVTQQILPIPSPDILDSLSLTKVTDTGANIPNLVSKVAEYLQQEGSGKSEIWIISDMQSSNWQSNSSRWKSAQTSLLSQKNPVPVRILSLRQRPSFNRSVRVESASVDQGILHLEILLSQQGVPPSDNEKVPLTLAVGDAITQKRIELSNDTIRIRREIPLPDGITSGYGYVALPPDDQTRDNVSYFTFAPQPIASTTIACASRKISKLLTNMVAPPGIKNRKAIIYDLWKGGELTLTGQSLLIWQGAPPVNEQAKKIEDFVKRGGCLLLFPDHKNATKGSAFPNVMWDSQEEAPLEQFYEIKSWTRTQGLLKDGVDHIPLPIGQLKAIKRAPIKGKNLRTIAHWNDDTPALAGKAEGSGFVVFCTSLPLYTWSNLGDGTILLPIVHRMIDSGTSQYTANVSLMTGSKKIPQSAKANTLCITHIGGIQSDLSPQTDAGIYQLEKTIFSTNRPKSEDNPEQIMPETIASLMPAISLSEWDVARPQQTLVEAVWQPFLILSLLCLLFAAFLSLPAKDKSLPTPFS